ncbi:hypothetical protein NBRC116494_00430 [Aurantivibrio plasticivorans]
MNQPANKQSVGRKQLLGLFAIAALSTFVPYIMFVTGWGIPEGTKNKGVLISEPASVAGFEFQTLEGKPWPIAEQEPKFRLVFLLDNDCDSTCEELMYLSRQVHIRLGREADQLERLFIWLGAQQPSDELLEFIKSQHPKAKVLKSERDAWLSMLSSMKEVKADLDGHEYYLLHRYSALVMMYTETQSGNDLLDDIKFLIKTSN